MLALPEGCAATPWDEAWSVQTRAIFYFSRQIITEIHHNPNHVPSHLRLRPARPCRFPTVYASRRAKRVLNLGRQPARKFGNRSVDRDPASARVLLVHGPVALGFTRMESPSQVYFGLAPAGSQPGTPPADSSGIPDPATVSRRSSRSRCL
jgi:hypothetical protein